jgi:hypothetical protein
MRVAFTILFIFLISFSIRSQARELSLKEKAALINLEKTINVKQYIEGSIPLPDLPLSEYLSYKVLKNSCSPLVSLLDKIQVEDESYKDQAKKLATLYGVCSHGVIGLTEIYINHKE